MLELSAEKAPQVSDRIVELVQYQSYVQMLNYYRNKSFSFLIKSINTANMHNADYVALSKVEPPAVWKEIIDRIAANLNVEINTLARKSQFFVRFLKRDFDKNCVTTTKVLLHPANNNMEIQLDFPELIHDYPNFPWGENLYDINIKTLLDFLESYYNSITANSYFSNRDNAVVVRNLELQSLLSAAVNALSVADGDEADLNNFMVKNVFPKLNAAKNKDKKQIKSSIQTWITKNITPSGN